MKSVDLDHKNTIFLFFKNYNFSTILLLDEKNKIS